jgi:hypothetical protein
MGERLPWKAGLGEVRFKVASCREAARVQLDSRICANDTDYITLHNLLIVRQNRLYTRAHCHQIVQLYRPSRYDIDTQDSLYSAEFVHFLLNVIHTKIDLNFLSRLKSRQPYENYNQLRKECIVNDYTPRYGHPAHRNASPRKQLPQLLVAFGAALAALIRRCLSS